MYALDFEYAGEKLSDYGMIICQFNSSSGTETISSGSDIIFNQIKSGGRNKFLIVSTTYESAYSTTFQICKDSCVYGHDKMTLSTIEISSIQRWLCRNQYNKFKIKQTDFENISWNATFSTKQISLNGQTIGMELTLYTDSPYAYMDEVKIIEDCSEKLSFPIYDMSDEEGYIYPDMEISILESGDFKVENSLNNKITKINNCTVNEIITIYGERHIIKSSTNHLLANDFNYVFPKIVNNYSNNTNIFTCNLKCAITICYSPIRKVGL